MHGVYCPEAQYTDMCIIIPRVRFLRHSITQIRIIAWYCGRRVVTIYTTLYAKERLPMLDDTKTANEAAQSKIAKQDRFLPMLDYTNVPELQPMHSP